jgi:hypothetical protein
MFTTQTQHQELSKGTCHMKYTNLCNEKKEPNHQHQGI